MSTGEKHELRICFSAGLTSNQVDEYSSCKLICCVSLSLSPSLFFAFPTSSQTQSPHIASHTRSLFLISQTNSLFAVSQYEIPCSQSTGWTIWTPRSLLQALFLQHSSGIQYIWDFLHGAFEQLLLPHPWYHQWGCWHSRKSSPLAWCLSA